MSAYKPEVLAKALAALKNPGSTTAVGMTLQDLSESLINEIPGAEITAKNVHNKANSEEKDLWISHLQHISGLPFADLMVPVECKNEAEPASSEEITRFETKIRDSGGSDGLLIAREGLAGTPGHSAHQAIEKALSQRIRIVVITGDDLAQLASPEDLVTLLQDRMTELRVRQTYESI